MMNVACIAVVGLVWALGGFTPTFGDDAFLGLIGGVDALGRHWNVAQLVGFASADPAVPWPGPDAIPVLAFAMFQLMFAIITPALISGAIVERAKFWFWAVFVALWSGLVYAPVGHWVFSFDGFLGTDSTGGRIANQLKAVDFAGGTVVHINAGAAALALAIVLGRRRGWPNAVAARTTCRSCCSAPACCGSAGTGSTPARRWRRTVWRPSRSPTPPSPRAPPSWPG
jgi:Amt family ammonium transporter